MEQFIKCTNDFCVAKEICNRHLSNNTKESSNILSILTQCFPYDKENGCSFFIPTKYAKKIDIDLFKVSCDRKENGGC